MRYNIDNSVNGFEKIQQGPLKDPSSFKMVVNQAVVRSKRRPKRCDFTTFRKNSKVGGLRQQHADRMRDFMLNHGDEVLSAQGSDLAALAKKHNVSTEVPVKEQQEQVFHKMMEKYVEKNPQWTKEQIVRQKKHFLDTIVKTHFFGLTCEALGLSENTVRAWMRIDPAFAEAVREKQICTAEKVAHGMLRKALVDEDTGAQMFLMKKFESILNFVEPVLSGQVQSTGLDISRLTQDEQETLLALMRKTQDTSDAYVPTQFDEDSPIQIEGPEQKYIESADDLIEEVKEEVPKLKIIPYAGD